MIVLDFFNGLHDVGVRWTVIITFLTLIIGIVYRTFLWVKALWLQREAEQKRLDDEREAKELAEAAEKAERERDRANIALILGQVTNNGGASLKDSVHRIERTVNFMQSYFVAFLEHESSCMFLCDENGATTWVNRALCDLCDCTPGDLLGLNWKNRVHADDRGRVSKEQSAAILEKRDNVSNYRVCTEGGAYVQVQTVMTRIIDVNGVVLGWSGKVRVV